VNEIRGNMRVNHGCYDSVQVSSIYMELIR
jgi:hypothetical protein